MSSEDDYKRPATSVGCSMGEQRAVTALPLAKGVRFSPNRPNASVVKGLSHSPFKRCIVSSNLTGGTSRAIDKQRSREDDARRLEFGEVTREQLRKENSFFTFAQPLKIVNYGGAR